MNRVCFIENFDWIRRSFFILVLWIAGTIFSFAQNVQFTENIILITYDGLRWQEVFTGPEKRLLENKEMTEETANKEQLFWSNNEEERRHKLMPFMWGTISQKGQIYGNRKYKNHVNVSNALWFSYPGYNEILTGLKNDPAIFANIKEYNPNVTILEYLNSVPIYQNKVAAFGSWELFPYILNERRCGFYVNAGNEPVKYNKLNEKEIALNSMLETKPSPWKSVRLDEFTQAYALDYLKEYSPKILFISFGETDELAHEGKYDCYLKAINQTDHFIEEIWQYVQSNENYRNKTTLIITTDHGRGYLFPNSWKKHGRFVRGSDQTWFAIIGPDTEPTGEVKIKGQLYQNQLAQTIASLLHIDYSIYANCGKTIKSVTGMERDELLTGMIKK